MGRIGLPEILVVLVGLIYLIFWLAALVSVLKNRFKDGSEKLIWVVVIILIPVLGPILYFIIGRQNRIRT